MSPRENAHSWLAEPLYEELSFVGKPMFGCEACYLRGLLVLVLADSEEPWNGILIPTERLHHDSLIKEFPSLIPHPVLGKWLFLSANMDNFERVAQSIVRAIQEGHPRIGVVPSTKKGKGSKVSRSSKKRIRARK